MNGFGAEFKHTLRRLRGQMIGWGIGLALYGLAMGAIFDTVGQIEGLEQMLASYPPEMMAFFGDITSIATPQGYFETYFSSYIPLIVGIFSVTAAAALIVGDEEKGLLDLALSHPVSRSGLFCGRWLGYVVATAVILLIGWLGWAVTLPFNSMDVSPVALLRPFVPIFALLLLFGMLALLFSMFLPSARLAAMTAGGLLVANFLLAGLANLNDNLQAINDLTPFHFYQGGDAMDALNWGWVALLLAVGVVLATAAWFLFLRRDIRVGGERSWSLGRLRPAWGRAGR